MAARTRHLKKGIGHDAGGTGAGSGSLGRWAVLAGYFISSLFIFIIWISASQPHTAMNAYHKAKVPAMIYGAAYKPFVYRTLLPTATRVVVKIVPDEMEQAAERSMLDHISWLPDVLAHLGWEEEFLLEYVVLLFFIYCFLLGFMFALRHLVRVLYAANDGVVNALPVIAIFILPIFFRQGTHFMYDFPALCFFTVLLSLLHQRQWIWFYPVLFLALLNKEPAILITLVHAVYYRNTEPRNTYWRHLGAQVALFLVVKAALSLVFRNNPGGLFEFMLAFNFHQAIVPYDFTFVVCASLFVISIIYKFSEKPKLLRVGLIVVIPLVLLYIFLGVYGEIRVFYELFPVLFLLSFHTAADVLRLKFEPHTAC